MSASLQKLILLVFACTLITFPAASLNKTYAQIKGEVWAAECKEKKGARHAVPNWKMTAKVFAANTSKGRNAPMIASPPGRTAAIL